MKLKKAFDLKNKFMNNTILRKRILSIILMISSLSIIINTSLEDFDFGFAAFLCFIGYIAIVFFSNYFENVFIGSESGKCFSCGPGLDAVVMEVFARILMIAFSIFAILSYSTHTIIYFYVLQQSILIISMCIIT